jgi:hypothetical protein
MRGRGWRPTTIPAQRRTQRRPRHPFAVPRTSLQCVCTRRRNCIEQLSPSSKYAPGTARFPARNSAIVKLTWLIPDPASFEAPHELLNVIVHHLSEIALIARGCRLAMGLHYPLNLLKGAGPIGRLCGGHIFVNRPFGRRDAIGVSNSNQSSQVAGTFFKICHPPNMRAVPRIFQPRTPPQSDCPRPKELCRQFPPG